MSRVLSFYPLLQHFDGATIGTNSSTLTSQIASIESCTQRVHDWLLNNGLHLNPSKSEPIAVSHVGVRNLLHLDSRSILNGKIINLCVIESEPVDEMTAARLSYR